MSSSTSILLYLPEELLAHIMTFLASDRASLHALLMTSRTLHRITLPTVYTHIILCPGSFRYLRPLAYLLFTSPIHASLVRSITVRRAYGGDLLPWPNIVGLQEVIRGQVEKWIKESNRERWLKEIWEGEEVDGHLKVAGLLVRSLEGLGKIGFDGWDLVDPSWEANGRSSAS